MKSYQGYMIDLDGTMYRGKEKIPAAKNFIERLQAKKIPFLFVTNNSTQEPEKVVQNLADNFDIHVSVTNVFTSALATADYLADLNINQRSVYAIGEIGLKKALLARGFVFDEQSPDYVVVGLDYDVTYHKFELATLAIKNGARFIGTNADTNLPNERGLVPGAGSLIALVERATQQTATYIGKPETIIMEKALAQMGLPKDKVVMVGDNYMTDISAGINFGMDTLLVYTGVSTKEQVLQKTIKPTYEIDSLDDWKIVYDV
ncbi:TIGR01457 family HAD-type hydrolase [Ligilactobacillus pobuzihii]|uniref:Acid sugar phosphatase n=1 Tax=Ligilactobacillus pobuzihii TaxID=449659 RepID=A0A0R2LD40_9LACO|nr:TIGR01457 family HAD-type hydrolase [Ligilactobacillus pobuzihii]KRK08979.1 N-acetylglucosamine catabolic protein [Ligilactobacillus pobuzihii E100301 = KCTC 13174]KRN99826.1 N-acetylglucosamine catabolic protein [Ligilactobacillus pobuzihii]GEN49303.1 acid sugar phosphatase [Ligilactobacillus pobuzihii]